MTDEDEEEAEVDQDQRFPLFSKPKAQRHDFSCNHQEESSESSESSDSKIRSNVTSASSANTSNKQAVLGAHSQRSVGARRGQLCFRLAVAAISWSASILSLMRFEVKLLIRSDTEGSTVCATRWLMFFSVFIDSLFFCHRSRKYRFWFPDAYLRIVSVRHDFMN